jgi:hypothetical protein
MQEPHALSKSAALSEAPPSGLSQQATETKCVNGVLIYELTLARLQVLEQHRKKAADCTVLGHLTVGSLGFDKFAEWAKETLHESFQSLLQVGNGFFEVRF